jgi:hypothetical protein
MKKQIRKLVLSKETVRRLEDDGLTRRVVGGTLFHVSDTCGSCPYCYEEPIR